MSGKISILYNVSDFSGNTATAKRLVYLSQDGEIDHPPVIHLKGNYVDYVPVGSKYEDKGAKAADEEDGDLTNKIEVKGADFSTDIIGEHEIIYSVTDSENHEVIITRKISVILEDIDPPIITIIGYSPGEIYEILKDTKIKNSGLLVAASDNLEGNITDRIVMTVFDEYDKELDVKTFSEKLGTYTIYLNVCDQMENKAETKSFTVKVSEEDVVDLDVVLEISNDGDGDSIFVIDKGNKFKLPEVKDAFEFNGTDVISLFDEVMVRGDFDLNVKGSYIIIYYVEGSSKQIVTDQIILRVK